MNLPDGRPLTVDRGVVLEPTMVEGRVVLWLPGGRADGDRHWERVGTVAHAAVTDGEGIRATAATSIATRLRPGRSSLAGLFRRLGRPRADRVWTLPTGQSVEQCGARRTDLVLAWSRGGTPPLDEARIRAHWPRSCDVRPVGPDLYLVSGIEREPSGRPAGPAPGSPARETSGRRAERALALAREADDPGRVVTALTDLGLACLKGRDARRAAELFEEALAGARRLGDHPREADVLGGLGLALLHLGQPGRAREVLGATLAYLRTVGDRYAEKAVLDHLGLAHVALGDHAEGLACFDRARAIAGELGDRRHEAALLWLVGIEQAELGRRDRAIASGEAAVALLRRLGQPTADWYAHHLTRYRSGDPGASAIPSGGPAAGEASAYGSLSIDAGALAARPGPPEGAGPDRGPGLLRMARTATESMAKFIGSGFQTTSPGVLEARLAACSSCPHHTGLRCRICGCFTDAKARLLHEDCPAGRWPTSPGSGEPRTEDGPRR